MLNCLTKLYHFKHLCCIHHILFIIVIRKKLKIQEKKLVDRLSFAFSFDNLNRKSKKELIISSPKLNVLLLYFLFSFNSLNVLNMFFF